MKRGPGLLLLLLLAAGVAPGAQAYHGQTGSAGLVVEGVIDVLGALDVRAQPGSALYAEGPAPAFEVRSGRVTATLVEAQDGKSPLGGLLDPTPRVDRTAREFDAPAVRLASTGHAFNALVFTRGGLAAFRLEAPEGGRLERAAPGALAPTREAQRDGASAQSFGPDAFTHSLAGPGVRVEAPATTFTADGDFTVFLYDATLSVRDARSSETYRTGSWEEDAAPPDAPGPTEAQVGRARVAAYLLLDFRAARLVVRDAGAFRSFHGEAVDFAVNGTTRLSSARGEAAVGGDRPWIRGDVLLTGVLGGSAWPTRGAGDAGLRFEARGDVATLAYPGGVREYPAASGTAAASALVTLTLVVAYFWRHLRFFAVAALYSRFTGPDVLDHAGRDAAYRAVRERPGASVNDVANALDLAWSTAAYHLAVLEREGFVVAERRGRHRRYFATDLDRSARAAFAAREDPTARRLLDVVAANPGVSQKEAAAAVGITPSTASWHLRRLGALGLVEGERVWRTVRYRVPAGATRP